MRGRPTYFVVSVTARWRWVDVVKQTREGVVEEGYRALGIARQSVGEVE